MVPTPTSPLAIKTPEKQVQGKVGKLERKEFLLKKTNCRPLSHVFGFAIFTHI